MKDNMNIYWTWDWDFSDEVLDEDRDKLEDEFERDLLDVLLMMKR